MPPGSDALGGAINDMNDIEAIAREWGARHPEYIRRDSNLLIAPKKEKIMPEPSIKTYACGFCPRQFEREKAMVTHQSQCAKNPNRKQWVRYKRTKHNDATITQPSDLTAISHNVGQMGGGTNNVAETVLVAWNKYLGNADETLNINQLSRDFLKKLINGEIL